MILGALHPGFLPLLMSGWLSESIMERLSTKPNFALF